MKPYITYALKWLIGIEDPQPRDDKRDLDMWVLHELVWGTVAAVWLAVIILSIFF